MYKALKKFSILFLAFLFFFSTSIPIFAQSQNNATPMPGKLYGQFDHESSDEITVIVELNERAIVESKHAGVTQSKSKLKNIRNNVINDVLKIDSNAQIHQEYDYLFSGFSITLSENKVRYLLTVNGIKAVYPNVTYEVEKMNATYIDSKEISPSMFDTAPYIGAEDAWNLGYTGKGITVAVIDTGVDYTHPDLKHAFGEYKGWDFVDNDNDPQETPTDPNDPEAATDHGTHVAGTIAANGEFIKGVAPNANLLAYRVLGPRGRGTTTDVLAGIERAVQDGADVMNLSLGADINDADYATSIALDWAMAEGVVAVTSNGNSGPDSWTVGSPGTSRDAISIGATRIPYMDYKTGIFTSEGVEYPSAKVMGHPGDDILLALNEGEYEYVFVGLAGTEEDFEGIDLEGKIAFMVRGNYAFVDKAQNAKDRGAIGAIIYNNVPGEQPEVPGTAIPMIAISNEDGQKMHAELAKGNNTVSFSFEALGMVGETIADFSSRGPVLDTWMIKPDVVAPGVNITSTVPTHNPEDPHGYAAFQGTSMSSPHVAGAVALLLEKHPDWQPNEIKSALMNTAESITDRNGDLYPLNAQGAGSIRLEKALTTETLIAPGSYTYGTFTKSKGKQVEKQVFEIKNLSKERKRYSMDIELFDGEKHIKVNTSNNLNVQPGRTQNVNMNVQVNASGLEAGHYEGMITITNGDEVLQVPTILFVGDPYDGDEISHLRYGGFSLSDEGIFDVSLYLNRDVDYVEFYILEENLMYGLPIAGFENIPAGESQYQIDASGILPLLPIFLPSSEYVFVVFIGNEDWEEGWILGYFN